MKSILWCVIFICIFLTGMFLEAKHHLIERNFPVHAEEDQPIQEQHLVFL